MNEVISSIAQKMNIPDKSSRLIFLKVEKAMRNSHGFQHKDTYKLEHRFAEGLYIRTLFVPKGHFIMSFIHKDSYPLFLVSGDWTEVTPDGNIRMQAPQSFITEAGAQKMGYANEDTVWTTVHFNPDNGQDIDKIEKRIYELHFDKFITMDEDELKLVKEMDVLKQFDVGKFVRLTKEVMAHEKDGFWSDWTKDQQNIYMSGDWEAFSRSRGYSEEEIATHKEWLEMKELGDSLGLNPLKYVREILIETVAKNIAKDTHGEILKSSHVPSSKKIPYKEDICPQ